MIESMISAAIVFSSIVFSIFIVVAVRGEQRARTEMLDAMKGANRQHHEVAMEHLRNLESLIKERDNARIEVCELSSNGSIDDAARHARIRGWGYLYNQREAKEDR
jgi:hypothetical protein